MSYKCSSAVATSILSLRQDSAGSKARWNTREPSTHNKCVRAMTALPDQLSETDSCHRSKVEKQRWSTCCWRLSVESSSKENRIRFLAVRDRWAAEEDCCLTHDTNKSEDFR